MCKCLNFELSNCMFSYATCKEVKCASWTPLWKNIPSKTGCTLLILVAVKHKLKLMHALMLLKRPIYLYLGLRPFSQKFKSRNLPCA